MVNPPLVFVGGTGRSGTHVVARILGRHSAYYAVPIECRFHCNPGGLADFVEGRTDVHAFTTRLRGFWWRRARFGSRVLKGRSARLSQRVAGAAADANVRGLHKLVNGPALDTAIKAFEAGASDDPLTASRDLFYELLSPLAAQEGKPGIVEMSCFTIAAAGGLGRIFPEAKFIHTVRDGRDAGSSKVSKRQKPKDPRDAREGIAWWEGRLRSAEAGAAALEQSRLLTVSFDQLVQSDREEVYARILGFLGLPDEPAVRDYFAAEVSAEAAHRDRWREGLDSREQKAVTALYEEALDRLEAEGARSVPLLREVLAGEALSQ